MQMLATPTDLAQLGVNAAALKGIAEPDLLKALSAASARALGYLRRQYFVPLTAWGDDLRQAVCAIAAWLVVSARRGFNPELGGDQALRTNYEDAVAWLRAVAAGEIAPEGLTPRPPGDSGEPSGGGVIVISDGEAAVVTEPRRGW
jgi:phage gp36-like protein